MRVFLPELAAKLLISKAALKILMKYGFFGCVSRDAAYNAQLLRR